MWRSLRSSMALLVALAVPSGLLAEQGSKGGRVAGKPQAAPKEAAPTTFSLEGSKAPSKAPAPAGAAPAPVAPAAPAAGQIEEPPSATANVNFRLLELFNVEQLPGSGSITFKWGEKTETIKLGAESGYYALGLLFRGNALPEQYGKDFSQSDILQIAMGSVRSKLQGQIPQFAAATVIMKGLPATTSRIPFVVPTNKENPLAEMAFLLVTSPTTPNERSDEEKLKGTYFAQNGMLTFVPKGTVKTIEAKSQGKRLSFKMRIYQVEFDATLATPFNAQPTTMRGTIEFANYWPNNREARVLTEKIAAESLESAASLNGPEGLTSHSRDVAGSNPSDAKKR